MSFLNLPEDPQDFEEVEGTAYSLYHLHSLTLQSSGFDIEWDKQFLFDLCWLDVNKFVSSLWSSPYFNSYVFFFFKTGFQDDKI